MLTTDVAEIGKNGKPTIKKFMREEILTNWLQNKDLKKEIEKENWQKYTTPFQIVDQMIETTDITDKKILVLFNLEFLERLIHKYNVPEENIKFIADTTLEGYIAKNMYYVKTKLCTKQDDWQKILIGRATSMSKHFDIVFSNPPYTQKIDLKIMHAVSDIADEMVVVHPSTWLIDLKGKSKLFNDTKDYFGKKIKSVTLFNGNPVFGIGLFVPCSITHIQRHKDEDKAIDAEYFGRKFKVEDVNDITNFGPEWEKIVKPFMVKMKQCVKKHGSVWDHNIKELVEGKHYCQLAAIRGNVNMASNGDLMSITQDDFYTLVMKDSDRNKGLRKDISNGMPTYDFDTDTERDNFISYCKTFFTRFCLSLLKNSQNCHRGELVLIPWLDFKEEWTDEKLFEHFNIDKKTQEYIMGFLPDYYELKEHTNV